MATVIVPPFASKSRILKKTAASLGITQLITSWAITICGLITYPHSMLDPHATMCLALALLGSASHAIPFWLGEFRTKKTSSRLRLGLCVAQTFVLIVAFLARKKSLNQRTNDESDDHVNRYETSLIVFMFLTFFWDVVLFGSSFGKGEPGCGLRTTNVLSAFFLTIVYISTVIHLKFKLRDCHMNTGDDNQWTFGQYLALFVLVAPIYPTLEAFLGM